MSTTDPTPTGQSPEGEQPTVVDQPDATGAAAAAPEPGDATGASGAPDVAGPPNDAPVGDTPTTTTSNDVNTQAPATTGAGTDQPAQAETSGQG